MKLALHWPSIPRYIRSIFFYYDKSQSKQRCENILPFALKILLPFKWGKVNQNCFMDLLSMDRPVRMLQACKAALIEIVPSKLPQPYSPIFWALSVSILFLMISVKIGRQRNSFNDVNLKILHRPKDLESMLLNFACLILLVINVGGYNVYWRG